MTPTEPCWPTVAADSQPAANREHKPHRRANVRSCHKHAWLDESWAAAGLHFRPKKPGSERKRR